MFEEEDYPFAIVEDGNTLLIVDVRSSEEIAARILADINNGGENATN